MHDYDVNEALYKRVGARKIFAYGYLNHAFNDWDIHEATTFI